MAQGRKQRVTLRQIAEETGYAVITVSKALRGERDIAEATKRAIREKAREMGYVQNAAASMLRTGRSMLIAARNDRFPRKRAHRSPSIQDRRSDA